MQKKIEQLIEAAIQAPSGDNCQPWRFEVNAKTATLDIFNIPERDESLYSHNQLASMIALGAAIENMTIAAAEVGLTLAIDEFPDKNDPTLIARIEINESTPEKQPLFNAIFKRVSNRKFYHKKALDQDLINRLSKLHISGSGASVVLVNDPGKKKVLAKSASMNERMLLENKHLHDFFYNHINWNAEENEKKKIGFYIETLEIPQLPRKILKLCENWNLVRRLNFFLPISTMLGLQNAAIYNSAPVIGAIIAPEATQTAFLEAGKLMEKLWLEATAEGLSLQPMTGIVFMMHKLRAGITHQFDAKQRERILDTYKNIEKNLGVKRGVIAMMFRLGYADPPSARSARFSIREVTHFHNS